MAKTNKLNEILKKTDGYKTYTVAGIAILTAISGYLLGLINGIEAVQVVETALVGAGIRRAL